MVFVPSYRPVYCDLHICLAVRSPSVSQGYQFIAGLTSRPPTCTHMHAYSPLILSRILQCISLLSPVSRVSDLLNHFSSALVSVLMPFCRLILTVSLQGHNTFPPVRLLRFSLWVVLTDLSVFPSKDLCLRFLRKLCHRVWQGDRAVLKHRHSSLLLQGSGSQLWNAKAFTRFCTVLLARPGGVIVSLSFPFLTFY